MTRRCTGRQFRCAPLSPVSLVFGFKSEGSSIRKHSRPGQEPRFPQGASGFKKITLEPGDVPVPEVNFAFAPGRARPLCATGLSIVHGQQVEREPVDQLALEFAVPSFGQPPAGCLLYTSPSPRDGLLS